MRKSKLLYIVFLPLIILIIVSTFTVIYTPIGKNLLLFFYNEEYGDEYKQTWKSSDGNISVVIDNKRGMLGIGGYDGYYEYENEQFEVMIIIDDYSSAFFKDGTYLFEGDSNFNVFSNIYSITVKSADSKISKYKKGDIIEFYQVN